MRSALSQAVVLITTLVAGVLVAPPLNPVMFDGSRAPIIGISSGVLLFFVLSRRSIPMRGLACAPKRRLLARSLVLTLKSAQEEALWRGVALGLLVAPAGRVGALVLSTVAFAAAHASSQGRQAVVHLLTGSVFGATYVVTGSLTAAMGSHAAYNVLIGAGLLAEQNLSLSANSRGRDGVNSIATATQRLGL